MLARDTIGEFLISYTLFLVTAIVKCVHFFSIIIFNFSISVLSLGFFARLFFYQRSRVKKCKIELKISIIDSFF